ncbi:NfeD family protein [Legionella drancourtii]|uniref:NfeD family protein n=1 Tax=Legionella drancourtii TaxID=168933 RepID=UPI0018F1F27E|nr:nodulation protein NfeD [Legionella drancourtii]
MDNAFIMSTVAGASSRLGILFFKITNILCAVLLVFLAYSSSLSAAKIVELSIKGPIGLAIADYVTRSIDKSQHADLIIIFLDTPGGLDEATRVIMQKILSSNVPIVTYVSSFGARAASAGTYLLYASTLAAMAPGTQLGAASPVPISAGFGSEARSEKYSSSMDKKIMNDALATIRSLAQLHGRDPVFAQKSVLNAATITATEALKDKVINYVALDVQDLLVQLDGVVVSQNNQKMTLHTSNPQIKILNPDWRTYFLSLITEPTVAYLLLLLGIYGIFFEFFNPGMVLPGVVGVISMLLALYAFQLLPVNYAGFLLILLGIGFIVAEAFIPSFGSLGVGGTAAFVLGSIMLLNSESPLYQIVWPVIGAMAVVNILIFILILGIVIKVRQQKIQNGLTVLLGAEGRALGAINLEGQAVIRGEIWSVRSQHFIANERPVKVVGNRGLILEVEEKFIN